ncbi:MAG TPA: substrate-binding domain-containing protein [Anaerolineae bacterium]|nr:substrate-binding domain-containing protein [Anaerolineae bacterium]
MKYLVLVALLIAALGIVACAAPVAPPPPPAATAAPAQPTAAPAQATTAPAQPTIAAATEAATTAPQATTAATAAAQPTSASAANCPARVPTADQEYIWVAANVAHPFYTEGKAGWDAAAKALGVKASLVGPVSADVQQQVTIIEQAIAKPTTAGILVYAVDYNALEPVLIKARQACIPVVNGNGDWTNKAVRDSFVGTANEQLGRSAADLVAKVLNGKGNVGIVSFITAQNHQERVKGFQDRVKEAYPNINVLGIASEDGSPESETKAAGAFLQAHPDVNLLWTTDAGSGFVAQVIKDQGLQGKVLAVGTDRTAEQLAAIKDGTVYATVTQDTFAEEWTSLHFLYWLYNKLSTVPDTCITNPAVITKDNVDAMSQPFVSKTPQNVGDQEYIWVAANVAHPFYTEGKAGWDAAAKALGVKASLVGPVSADVQQQVTIIEQAIAKPTTGGILVYAVDYNALEPVLIKAREAGIPVVNGNGDWTNKAVRDSFVGTANEQLGRSAADLVAKVLNGKGNVGIVSFITAQNHQERVKGFEDRLKEAYPDIKVLGVASEDGSPESETKAAGAFLQAHPDVNLLWTTDAGSGFVAQVIKEQGLQGKVLAVGTDRTAEQIAAIKDGTVYATITQDTFSEEWTSLHFLFWLKNGQSTVPDTCITSPAVLTKDNLPQ